LLGDSQSVLDSELFVSHINCDRQIV